MNVADMSRAPPEFLEYADIAKLCKLMMGVGWITNYVGMIYNSFKYKTYGMSLMPLCCNFAWEMVYFFIYPFGSDVEKYIHTTGLAINCLVMTTAVLYAPNEWEHAPLVRRNLPLIFVTCVLGFMSAHLALAMQVGPHLGQAWSAFACQVLLTVGGLSQLISRGSSRGASYFLWFSRFFGSLVLVPQDYLRYKYWPEDHQYLGSPVYIWFVAFFLVVDGSYGVALFYVRRFERETAKAEKSKKK